MSDEAYGRTIQVRFAIYPATETTCGDGSGAFCRHCQWTVLGAARCDLFGDIEVVNGWLQRRPECIVAEKQGGD